MGQIEATPQKPSDEDCECWESEDLLKLFESGDGSDFTLGCAQTKFGVHKEILSQRSDVFDCMIRSSKDDAFIHITDIGSTTLEGMLRFIYSGMMPTNMSVANTMKLFEAGVKYEIEPLKKKCLNLLIKHLNVDNACEMLLFADNRKIGKLKDVVIPYLADKKEFLLTESFKIFYEAHPELAIDVLLAFVRKTP